MALFGVSHGRLFGSGGLMKMSAGGVSEMLPHPGPVVESSRLLLTWRIACLIR